MATHTHVGRLFQRGRIYWLGYPSPHGYVRESSGSTERADAEALLRQRLALVGQGWDPEARHTTVGQLLDLLVEDYRVQGKASLPQCRSVVATLCLHLGRATPATHVRTPQLYALTRHWQEAGVAHATINRRWSLLRRAYRLGMEAQLVHRCPMVPRLREDNVRQGFVEDVPTLLDAFGDDPVRDLVAWLAVTGMRVGEAKALEWKHVHGPELRIPAGLTKNRKARVLPLVGPLVEIIEARRKARRLDCPFLFHRDGQPVRDFRHRWHTACMRVGLGHVLVHDLRRTAVRNLIQAGVDPRVAREITGHRTASVFERYQIVTTGETAAALGRLAHGG